ncbi:MAG: hypothetical protein M1489_06715 [Firmicutes bacterium]|nr:hypothetical protein [Bacillota bacterium]
MINETLIIRYDASWKQKIKFIRELRKKRYDTALVSFDCRSLFAMVEILLAGIPVRIGHTVEKIRRKDHLHFVFNFPVPLEAGRHETDLKLDLVSVLINQTPMHLRGIKVDESPIIFSEQKLPRIPLFFCISETSRLAAGKLLAEMGLLEKKPFICVQPGAANAMNTPKRWPLEKFAVLLDRLIKELDLPVFALGDAAECQIIETLQEMMEGELYILAGKTGVKEVAAIIEKASLILCHDSGLMHVAVAVGTPVVALYGPTDYHRTRPLGEMHTVIKKDLDCSPCMYGFKSEADALKCPHRSCMNLIEPEEVFEIIKSLFTKTQGIIYDSRS